jgi:hypothetical protein
MKPRHRVNSMPRWWQEQHGVCGIIFHDEIILIPDNYGSNPNSKWAHFKTTKVKSQFPTPQNISRDMFRRIHPSQKNSASVNDRAEMQSLPTRPGCYAVIRDKQVLYVGASSVLRERCHRFICTGEKADRLYFWVWRYPYSLEYILISFLAPKDNCHGKYNKFPAICAWNGKFREELDI